MLGSPGEADDAVQEAWLRFSRTDTSAVENLGSWLTTVVSRVCLNLLQARRLRPESPFGEEVPEPAAGSPHRRQPGSGVGARGSYPGGVRHEVG
jgi:DNA-directed RNA polymerase specialized sigma24 family protein